MCSGSRVLASPGAGSAANSGKVTSSRGAPPPGGPGEPPGVRLALSPEGGRGFPALLRLLRPNFLGVRFLTGPLSPGPGRRCREGESASCVEPVPPRTNRAPRHAPSGRARPNLAHPGPSRSRTNRAARAARGLPGRPFPGPPTPLLPSPPWPRLASHPDIFRTHIGRRPACPVLRIALPRPPYCSPSSTPGAPPRRTPRHLPHSYRPKAGAFPIYKDIYMRPNSFPGPLIPTKNGVRLVEV